MKLSFKLRSLPFISLKLSSVIAKAYRLLGVVSEQWVLSYWGKIYLCQMNHMLRYTLGDADVQ